MIEEQGRVVATEPGAVWVETVRRSTCSSCSANAGCGQGLMQRLGVGARRARVRALSDLSLRVGDAVVLEFMKTCCCAPPSSSIFSLCSGFSWQHCWRPGRALSNL